MSSNIAKITKEWQRVLQYYGNSNKNVKINNLYQKTGQIELMDRPHCNQKAFIYKHFYRLCKDVVTAEDFDDDKI